MIKKLSFITLTKSVIDLIEKNTGLRCYDTIPKNAKMPYYQVQFAGQKPIPQKTMWQEEYHMHVKVYTSGNNNVDSYKAIQNLEEAMTEAIQLPKGYELKSQIPLGAVAFLEDKEEKYKQVVVGYKFEITYGYKIK